MIPAISPALGQLNPSEWSVGSVGGAGAAQSSNAAQPSSGSFSGALSNAVSSLEQTQTSATNAAQGLATGQLSDPTQAVTAVENASLSMDLAAQIRDKLISAETTIFNTQV
ncbi:MAG TPA: flagellar hook-basal body complex protein FliE [Solirubrobacteraceae bacterium]